MTNNTSYTQFTIQRSAAPQHTHSRTLLQTGALICLVLAFYIGSSSSCSAQCMYVSSLGTNNILQYDATTGTYVKAFVPSGSGGLTNPDGILFGQSSDMYVANSGNGIAEVLRYNGRTGAFRGVFVAPGNGSLGFTDMTWGPNGDLYVSDFQAHNVKEYNGLTGAFVRAIGTNYLVQPQNLVFGPNRNLYVADEVNVVEFNGSTGAFIRTIVPNGSGGLQEPESLAFGLDGNLLVGDALGHSVLKYNGATGAFMSAFISSGSGGLNEPHTLVFRNGNLFIPDYKSNSVKRYNGTTGAYLGDFVSAGSGGLNAPTNLALPPSASAGCH